MLRQFILEKMVVSRLIDAESLSIVKVTDDVKEAVTWISQGMKPRATYP